MMDDVSRETMERLELYAALLKKWNPRINLVSKSTIPELWTRHFLDSAQIFDLYDDPDGGWLDIGSGGGFPGLVVAILAAEKAPTTRITLVESDRRKATFLRQVVRETGISAQVLDSRIQELASQGASTISARALADLSSLCAFAAQHLSSGGTALFPKGATWEKEVSEAQKLWRFDLEATKSVTDPAAVILKLREIARV